MAHLHEGGCAIFYCCAAKIYKFFTPQIISFLLVLWYTETNNQFYPREVRV